MLVKVEVGSRVAVRRVVMSKVDVGREDVSSLPLTVVVDGAGDGDRMEEDIQKKEAKEEGGGSREIRFRVN